MEVVNLGRMRRFLREHPIRVSLFDRPRLVCDMLCLEPAQQESRRGQAASDELYVVIEGQAHLRAGAQSYDLETLDSVLVPPGVDHLVTNTGSERLAVLIVVAPKPTRAGEVRLPREPRPLQTSRPEETREEERPPPRSPRPSRFAAPAARGPRSGDADRAPYPPRRPAGAPYPGRRPAAPGRGRPYRPETREDGEGTDRGRRPAFGAGGSHPGGPPRGRPAPTGGGRPPPQPGGRPPRPGSPVRDEGGTESRGRATGPRRSGGRPPAQRGGPPRPGRPAAGRNGRPGPGRSGPRTSGRRPGPS